MGKLRRKGTTPCSCDCKQCEIGAHCYDSETGCQMRSKGVRKELERALRSGHERENRAA